jgi:hypothetical protein
MSKDIPQGGPVQWGRIILLFLFGLGIRNKFRMK